jgi:outer membrane lipoprotein-sorting protein
MLAAVFTVALLGTDTANPIQTAIDYYRNVAGYQLTLKSFSGGNSEIIRYYFKKPGYVRMEFVTPHRGAVLVYSPDTARAKLWPFGYKRFPSLTLSPDSRIIQSPTGQRVDRSDVGVLYQNVRVLQEHGSTEVVGIESVDGHEALHVAVAGGGGFAVGVVARYQLWLDRSNAFPLKVTSYDGRGGVIETVEMEDIKISPQFPDGFFKQ